MLAALTFSSPLVSEAVDRFISLGIDIGVFSLSIDGLIDATLSGL